MNRAEKRKLLKTGNVTVRNTGFGKTLTPYEVYKISQDVKKDIIKQYGDQAAISFAREEGYDAGYTEGAKFVEDHYLKLAYICVGLAMRETQKFGQKRILSVWKRTNELYAGIADRVDAGEDLNAIEREFNRRLIDEVGIKLFDDTDISEDDVGAKHFYGGGGNDPED